MPRPLGARPGLCLGFVITLGFLAAGGCSLHDVGYLQDGSGGSAGGKAGNASSAGNAGQGAGMSVIPSAGQGGDFSSADAGAGGEIGSVEGGAGGTPPDGEGGAGGDPGDACGAPESCVAVGMVSDFEEPYDLVCSNFSGHWQVYSDGSKGTSDPDVGSVNAAVAREYCDASNGYALHFSGNGFTSYGPTLSVQLSPANNLTGFTGLRFSASTSKAGSKIKVKQATEQTMDTMYGGTCVFQENDPETDLDDKRCDDYHSFTVNLSLEGWRRYDIRFDQFKQEGWGTAVAFDPTKARDIAFQPPGAGAGGSADFDFWIDDVEYY